MLNYQTNVRDGALVRFNPPPLAGTKPRPASPGPCPARFQALAAPRAHANRLRAHPFGFTPDVLRQQASIRRPGALPGLAPRAPCSRSARRFRFSPSPRLVPLPSLVPDRAPARSRLVPVGFEPSPSPSGPPQFEPSRLLPAHPNSSRPHLLPDGPPRFHAVPTRFRSPFSSSDSSPQIRVPSPDPDSACPAIHERHNVTFTRL
jgi:hypothetical protein